MNFIIFDLEATCGEAYQRIRNETIEIGAVKLTDSLNLVGEFSEFVKPIVTPILTPFCTNLTSITQEQVDSADTFPAVIERFIKWISDGDEDYILLSWGAYDKKQFRSDCELHRLDDSWVFKHMDFKSLYAQKKNVAKCGMKVALLKDKLPLLGTHHRGIDDARNIARIFVKGYSFWEDTFILLADKRPMRII